jgi:hypothetical protein
MAIISVETTSVLWEFPWSAADIEVSGAVKLSRLCLLKGALPPYSSPHAGTGGGLNESSVDGVGALGSSSTALDGWVRTGKRLEVPGLIKWIRLAKSQFEATEVDT